MCIATIFTDEKPNDALKQGLFLKTKFWYPLYIFER